MYPSLQGGTTYLQGGTNTLQGGDGTSLQGSPNTLQVGADPTNLQFGSALGATPDPATTPGGTYTDPAVAAAAAKRAQAQALKGGLTGLVNNIHSVYNAIYGDLDTVGADKTKAVNQRYNTENTALVDQFNTDFPQIGNAYSARNTYDSSYRQDSEGNAVKQFGNAQDSLSQGRNEDVAKVGQYIATQRAQAGADQGTLTSIQDMINASEDPAELQQLQQTLNQRLADVTASRAGLRSQDAYMAEANSLVDTTDRSAGLRQNISNIVAGQAPAPLKRSIANKLIQSSGLPAAEQQALINDFEKQLSGDSTQPVDQQVAA